jgi:lysophospholipase L1-like esterase
MKALSLAITVLLSIHPAIAHEDDIYKQKFYEQKFRYGFNKHQEIAPYMPPYNPPQVSALQPNDVIAIAGDSVTAYGFYPSGWASDWQQYLVQYHPELGTIQFLNFGVPGDNSSQLAARFAEVLAGKPTVVIIWIGVNDVGLTGGNPNYVVLQQNIQAMIYATAGTSIRVILCGPFCIGERYDGGNAYDAQLDVVNQEIANIAAANGIPFINMRQVWKASEYQFNPASAFAGVLTSDGVHPNAFGAQIVEGTFIRSFGL